jgi:ATP-dependent Lon protease
MGSLGLSVKQSFEAAAGSNLREFIRLLDIMAKDPDVKELYKDVPRSIKGNRSLRNLLLDDLQEAAIFIYKDVEPKDRPVDFYKTLLDYRDPGKKITRQQATQALNAKIQQVMDNGSSDEDVIAPRFTSFYAELPDHFRKALSSFFGGIVNTLPGYAMTDAVFITQDRLSAYATGLNTIIESVEMSLMQEEEEMFSLAHPEGDAKSPSKLSANDISGQAANDPKASPPADIDKLANKSIQNQQESYVLKERLIQINKRLKELGEKPEGKLGELTKKVEEAGMPPEALDAAREALGRMEEASPRSSEYNGLKEYVTWLVSIPWGKMSPINGDIVGAERILDEDHYGLEKAKQAIIEYVAVQNRTKRPDGTILCLVGPPGIGKTSLGTSIARATGREFVRLSLGGLHEEAQIRGYEPSYKSAMPGKVVQAMKKAGTANPLMLLDEIDKLGHSDTHGDPSAALLEVLDHKQNATFRDNYLGVGYDLSKVLFVTTANYEDKIPEALRDRMEIIRLPSYTADEKFEIARRHLVPRQMAEKALTAEQFSISDSALSKLILEYTSESGVRGLEKELGKLARRTVLDLARGKTTGYQITPENLKEIAGTPKVSLENIPDNDTVGLVNGLAYTSVGGCLLQIEAVASPGRNFEITATGDLGKHIKESVDVARGLIKNRAEQFGVKDAIEKMSISLNAPADSPKDGPSAGAAITLAIISALLKIPVRREFAMTGKIGLNGQILPIGGVREKLQGALNAGATTVLIPKANEKDLADVPESIKSKLIIHSVSKIEEVLQFALVDNVLRNAPAYDVTPQAGPQNDGILVQSFKAPAGGDVPPANASNGNSAPRASGLAPLPRRQGYKPG